MTWWNPRTWSQRPAPALPAPSEIDALVRARAQAAPPKKTAAPEPRAWTLDPQVLINQSGEEEVTDGTHPGTLGVPYETLQAMARVPDVAAIVHLRVGQCAEHATPQESRYQAGFSFRLKDRSANPTRAQQREMARLTDWLLTCGDPRIDPDANFESFMRAWVRDAVVYDQGCFEVVTTRGGDIAGFCPVDGASIRRVRPNADERANGRRDPSRAAFVQIVDHRIRATWTSDEFCFWVRRPRTWLYANGYGYPELEELIAVVTWMMGADTFNANNFKNGLHHSGILALVSKMNPSLFRAFRREFYSMLKGASNSKKTPLIQLDPENKEDLKAINLTMSNKDMEFKEWRSDLRKIMAALFLCDLAELGWMYGNEGQTSTLSSAGPEERIIASRERGLRPLLRGAAAQINRKVISRVAPEYELAFVGFDQQSEAAEVETLLKKVGKIMTYDEGRAALDLPPLKTATSSMIGDSTYINAEQQATAAAQAAEGGEDGAEGDAAAPEGQDAADGPPEPPSPADGESVAEMFKAARVRRLTVETL